MNRYRLFVILSVLLSASLLYASEENYENDTFDHIIKQVVMPYVESLRTGNVTAARQLISGKFYQRNRTLLEENRSYSDYLKNYYKEADFTVKHIQEKTGWVNVEIGIQLPDRKPYAIGLRIENLCKNGLHCKPTWKIVDEVAVAK